MDYGNILYLTNFIKNDVTDREEELRLIYEKAVKESESYIALSQMKQVLSFFDNGSGARLLEECDGLLSTIFDDPANGPEILGKMRMLVQEIQAEEERSMEVLESLGKEGRGLSVVSKEINALYGEMLNDLAHSFIYYLLVTDGEDSISELRWNDDNSLNVKLNIFNDEILARIKESESEVFCWKIERETDDHKIKFSNIRYRFDYISYDEYDSYRKCMDRLHTNLYADRNSIKGTDDQIMYVGMGNIIPCDIKDVVERLENNSVFVVSPRTVCDLMNEFENARVIYGRQRAGKCLFCGKDITGNMVCPEHFKIERIS